MIFSTAIPRPAPTDIIEWADNSGIKVDGHSFDSTRTPQLIEPIRAMADADTRIGTLIKPVQIGGSTAGEIVCAYWAAFYHELIQYNWQNDDKAADRWADRILPTLESCRDIKRSGHRFEELICEARYINSTVRIQGVFNESSLDSDTVPLQINEEIHLWKPGFLGKARRRQTQVWNAKAFDISNASNENDQLHSAYEDGTQERWEVLCPKCGAYHEMRFRFNPSKPELGGLRWDSDGCKMGGGRFNYNKLERTIRYEFPCGHTLLDHPANRRTLAGRYSKPNNEGAHLSHRSWNFEAVSCDSIRWLTLIQEWHSAIRAQRNGDLEPMRRFVTERECRFWSPESVPFSGRLILKMEIKKNREGLQNRSARLWAADRQRGYKSKNELSHYWLVIRDFDENLNSLLVFEGKVETESELVAILEDHKCSPIAGGIDASWDGERVMEFCLRFGCHAFLGNKSHMKKFPHEITVDNKITKTWRYYSDTTKIDNSVARRLRLSTTKYELVFTKRGPILSDLEPKAIDYNLSGMMETFFFIRGHEENTKASGGTEFISWDTPGDVSEDYRKQLSAYENTKAGFVPIHDNNHMTMCEAYIIVLLDSAGFIAPRVAQIGMTRFETKPTQEGLSLAD